MINWKKVIALNAIAKNMTTLLTWLNRLLVADFFLVLFAFFWFAIAVAGHYAGIPLGFEVWQKLWIPLFNPAIGILMAGALLSWGVEKVAQRFGSKVRL